MAVQGNTLWGPFRPSNHPGQRGLPVRDSPVTGKTVESAGPEWTRIP